MSRKASMTLDITIAITCYNESQSIIKIIEKIIHTLSKTSLLWEIIVLDDASTDGSTKKVQGFIKSHSKNNIFLHVNQENQGLETNVFKAAGLGSGKYFWVVAGDNNLDEQSCFTMLSSVGKADIVIPYILDYQGRGLIRKFISKLYVYIVNFLSKKQIKYYNGSSIYLRKDVEKLAQEFPIYA